jgi:hypothetical protein
MNHGYAGFDFVFHFSNLQVAGGGTVTGLTTESGGTLPYASTSFTGSTITVNLQGTFFLPGDTSLSTTFDIATTTTVTAVPEPSTAVAAVFGAVSCLAYGRSRHRRAQRRQSAA